MAMNLSDMACQIRAKCEYGLTDCALVAISRRIFGRNPTNFWRCLRLSSCGSCKVVSKPSSEVTLIQEAIPKHATYHALVFTVSKLLEYEPTICTWSEHTIQPTIHSQKNMNIRHRLTDPVRSSKPPKTTNASAKTNCILCINGSFIGKVVGLPS